MKMRWMIGCALLGLLMMSPEATAQDGAGGDRGQRPGQRSRQRQRGDDGGLKVGQLAPTFVLKSLDGKAEFVLQKHRGSRPVVLFFGSYT